MKDFGFYEWGVDRKGRDCIFVKTFPSLAPNSDENSLEYSIKYYPFIKIQNNSVFLVPIKPEFHRILFPEIEIQPDLFGSPVSSAGNAIKQAYLCKSQTKSIKPGDILFFYRTGDLKAITTYGVVEQFHIENDPDKIFQWVSKRTVYSYEDINKMAGTEVKVILFRFVRHLNERVPFSRLKESSLVAGSIQSILKLPRNKVKILIQEAKISDCVLSN